MAELNATLDRLNQTMDAILEKLGGKAPGSSIGGPADGTVMPTNVVDAMKAAGSELKKIAEFGVGVTSVFKAIDGSKQPIIDAFKAIASLPQFAKARPAVTMLENQVTPNVAALPTGKDTDIVKQGIQERGTTLSYADFQKMMSQNQPGLTGAGSIQNDRTDNLYRALQQLIDQNKDKIAAGATSPEALARALIQSQQQSRDNLATPEGRGRAVAAASRLADEIDAVAKRTGESREVIAEQNAKRIASGDEQATLALLSTDKQRQLYIKAQNGMTGLGEDYQKLAKEYVQFGAAISPEAQAKQAALGPAAFELREAMLRLKNATSDNARAEAEAAIEKAKASAIERQRDPRVARMAVLANAFPEESILQGAKRGFEQNREAPGYNYNRNTGVSPERATGVINTQVGNLQAGQQQTGLPPTEGMRVQQAIIEGNITAAQKAGDAYRILNNELGTNKTLVNNLVDAIRKAEEIKLPTGQEKKAETTGDNKTNKPVTETTNPELKPPNSKVEPVKKLHGTLGTTGSIFEPKDIVALLHKGERVLSPSENADLTNLFGMVSDLKPKSNLGSALSGLKTPSATDETTIAEEETGTSNMLTADTSGVTIKDLYDSLQQLNTNIEVMVSHTADMKDSSRETADMSGKMTGNRLAV
jgi:hypothetical protein